MNNKTSYYLVLSIGILTCLQFIPHGFMGYQAVLEHIDNGEIQPIAAQGMQMIWVYSSIMMLLSGIWMLFLAKPIKQGNHAARIQGLFLSIGLILFGLSCNYIAKDFFNNMFFFNIEGILLLLAVTVFYKSKKYE